MTVPYAFGNTPTGQSIPLSHLDDNFDAVGNSANVSFIQNTLGAVRRTSQSKMADVVSVLDFGADPTGVSDSTAAIQAAVNFAAARPSNGNTAVVVLPAGTYKITDTININKDIRFIGDGGDATIINLTVSTPKEAIRVTPAPGGYIWFAELNGFLINCKAGSVAGDGIVVISTAPSAVSQSSIRNVRIRDFRDGITLEGTASNETYLNEIYNVKMVGASTVSGVNDVRYGLRIASAAYNTVRNVEVTNVGNAGYSIFCQGASAHFEHITTDGVASIDSPWGVIDHWVTEEVYCVTPVINAALSVGRLASLRAVTLIEVKNSKCAYGVRVEGGSQGMTISDITIEQTGGNRPDYPLSIPPASRGTVINWKGAGAYLIESYTDASYIENWRFINSSDITNREVGVKNVASGGKPTASDKLRGQLVLEKGGVGVADVIYVCRKNAADTYEWQALA